MSEFEQWWEDNAHHFVITFDAATNDSKELAIAAWNARREKDATICLDVDPPLSSDAAPEVFAAAILAQL